MTATLLLSVAVGGFAVTSAAGRGKRPPGSMGTTPTPVSRAETSRTGKTELLVFRLPVTLCSDPRAGPLSRASTGSTSETLGATAGGEGSPANTWTLQPNSV